MGRFTFFLALLCLVGMMVTICWAGMILAGSVGPAAPGQVYPPALFAMTVLLFALAPRRAEGGGDRRGRWLRRCFSLYRWRRPDRWLVRHRRVALLVVAPGAIGVAAGLALPGLFAMTSIAALRRAAWFGHPDAILVEINQLKERGPISTPSGRRLAALMIAR